MPVFEPESQLILNGALAVACRFGAARIGTDHMLLAISDARGTAASECLYSAGASSAAIAAKMYNSGYTSKLSATDMTPSLKCALEVSCALSEKKPISAEVLLRALLADRANTACRILAELRIDIDLLSYSCISGKSEKSRALPQNLLKYGRDLSLMAEEGKLDACIGRNSEICELAKVLCRRSKNNACLVGEAGVGKTAIVEGLANLLASPSVPEPLRGKRIYALDLSSMVAGAKYRGEFEERMRTVLRELYGRNTVIFIDEMHTIIGAGSAEGSIDACGILKPALSRSGLQVIGATTFDEYEKYIEKDRALARRFQKIAVAEPTPSQCREMLCGIKRSYEKFHGIEISDSAIDSAIGLSVRFMPGRFLPDKAIDVIDGAACAMRLFGDGGVLLPRHIEQQVSSCTGIPPERICGRISLSDCAKRLKSQVFGQDSVIDKLCDAVSAGTGRFSDDRRPIASLVFSGPSGVGKTALAKALARELFGDDSFIRLDMSEYSEAYSVSRLIGSPPGYVGYDEGGRLVSAVRRRPYSVVLFDEIEKAHPDIFGILLQILDGGTLTDSQGRKADFGNTVVILTTNAASAAKTAGFVPDRKKPAFGGLFMTELVGRFDRVLEFSPLDGAALQQICTHLLDLAAQKALAKGVNVEFSPDCAGLLAACSADGAALYGARALKREIEHRVYGPLGRAVLSGASSLCVYADGENITVSPSVQAVR